MSAGKPVTTPAPRRKGTGGRPALADVEGRNKRIMKVATELFLTRGYSATSLGDIAVTAGVAKKTIYSWYGDKSAIFSAIIRSEAERLDFTSGPVDVAADEALFRLACRIRDVTVDPFTTSVLQLLAGESKTFPDLVARVSVEGAERMYEAVEHVLAALKLRGQLAFDDADLKRLSIRFFDAMIGISSLRKLLEKDHGGPPDAELRERVDAFLLYLRSRR